MDKRPKLRKDFAETAFSVFRQAIGEPIELNDATTEEAKKRGRAGGLRGGKARAERLTPEERSKIAKKANLVRNSKKK